MEATSDLPDGLMLAMRERARAEGRTAEGVVEEAPRAHLAAGRTASPVEPLPSWGSPDGRVLVDLGDRDALPAVLDEPA